MPHDYAADRWPYSWMAISSPITMATATYDIYYLQELGRNVSLKSGLARVLSKYTGVGCYQRITILPYSFITRPRRRTISR